MLNDLTKSQKTLAHFMSDLSEEAYHAGWMVGLEYALWTAVIKGPRKYGRLEIKENYIEKLKKLSADCRGWIYFDESMEETFVDIESWKSMYQNTISKYKSKIS